MVTATSTRRYKPIPSVLSKQGSSEKRREMFLKKVQREREERRWQARGGDDEVYLFSGLSAGVCVCVCVC